MNSIPAILVTILAIDAAAVTATAAVCDNFVTPKVFAAGLGIVLVLTVSGIRSAISGRIPLPRPGLPGMLFMLWFAWSCLTVLFSNNPMYSLGHMRLPLIYLLVYIAAISGNVRASGKNTGVLVLAGAGMLFSIHAIAQYFGVDFLPGQSRYLLSPEKSLHAFSIFGNPNLLAEFLAVSLPASLYCAIGGRSRLYVRTVFAVATAVIVIALALTGSRAALLAGSAGAIAAAVISSKNSRKPGILTMSTAAAVIVLVTVSYIFITAGIRGKKDSTLLRLHYWKTAVEMFDDRPLGSGPGTFSLRYLPYQEKYFKSENHYKHLGRLLSIEKPGHPHNEYLNALVETGLPGAFLLAAFFMSGIATATRGKGGAGGAWAGALIALAIASFFGFPLLVPTTGILLPLSLAAAERSSPGAASRRDTTFLLPEKMITPAGRWILAGVIASSGLYAALEQYDVLEARLYLTKAKRAAAVTKWEQAEMYAARAMDIYPDNGEILFMMGSAELARGDSRKALEFFDHAQETSADINIFLNMGTAYAGMKNFDAAEKSWNKAEAISPYYIKTKKILAGFYLRQFRYADAYGKLLEIRELSGRPEEQVEKLIEGLEKMGYVKKGMGENR